MTLPIAPLQPRHETFVCAAFCNERKHAKDSGFFLLDDPKARQLWWDCTWYQFWTALSRPSVTALVAHGSDPNAFRGFVAVDKSGRVPYLIYVSVKEVYRRAGHANALFSAAGFNPRHRFHYACQSPIWHRLTAPKEVWSRGERVTVPPKYQLATYDPLWARLGRERAND